ncbi:MAG: glycosyltransferase family 2 protein [Patescibacteria group bacterium]
MSSIFSITKNIPFEVILLDNASSDGSSEMVKNEFGQVVLIEQKKNVGFAKGVNTASKTAKGEYLLLVNSDTQILEGSIGRMVDYMQKNEKVGVLGGRLQDPHGTVEKSFGSFPTLFSVLFDQEKVDKELVGAQNVDWVNGGFMLLRKSLFVKLGGFDEYFFMYVEDIDFCYRVKKSGYLVAWLSEALVTHVGQGSSDRSFAIARIFQGYIYFFKKHKNAVEYTVVRVLLVAKACTAILVGLLLGRKELKNTYIKALFSIL